MASDKPLPDLIKASAVIIGAGPAGRKATSTFIAKGLGEGPAILIDRLPQPGGNNLFTGAVPSKALWAFIRKQLIGSTPIKGAVEYRQRLYLRALQYIAQVQQHEALENLAKLDKFEEAKASREFHYLRGVARLNPDRTLTVTAGDDVIAHIETKNLVIATGSRPRALPQFPWAPGRIVSSDTILETRELPDSLVVIGGGIVGIEYACYFAALGTKVAILNRSDRILSYSDPMISDYVSEEVEKFGIEIINNARVTGQSVHKGESTLLELNNHAALTAEMVLVAAGRERDIEDLNLTVVPGLYESLTKDPGSVFKSDGLSVSFAGDVRQGGGVVGNALRQGHRVIGEIHREVSNDFPTEAPPDPEVPTAIYSFPPVAFVGLPEQKVKELGVPYVVGVAMVEDNSMANITGTREGFVKLIFNSNTGALLGAHLACENAHDIINVVLPYLHQPDAMTELNESQFSYPSLSGLYRQAAQVAEGILRQSHLANDVGAADLV